MKLLYKVLISAILVLVISHFMKGIHIADFKIAVLVAVVLGLLNTFVKPVLVFFTLPVTIFTLGLFLLVINGIMVLVCDKIIDGFSVNGFVTALIFSIILSVSQSIAYFFFVKDKD